MDRGPWRVYKPISGEVGITSDDFAHDVILYINGDFIDYEERVEYAEWLARKLNG